MAITYPTSLDTLTNPTIADNLNTVTVPHATQHADANDILEQLEAKVGIGSSTPITNSVLAGTSAGVSGWTATPTLTSVTLTGDLAVNGGDLTSTATTFNLLAGTVTTLGIGAVTTSLNVQASATAAMTSAFGAAGTSTYSMVIGGAAVTAASLEINARGTSGTSFIDFGVTSDDGDYAFRIQRATAAAGGVIFDQKGGGNVRFTLTGGSLSSVVNDANTASTIWPLLIAHNTTGTGADGIGTGIQFNTETSTTADQFIGRVDVLWTTAAHATRTSAFVLLLVNSGITTEVLRATGAGALTLGVAGTTLGVLKFSGNTSGTISMQGAAAAGTWTFTLPPDDGDAGEQLQTNGSGVTTWEAAASYREAKNLLGYLDPRLALQRIMAAPVHRFTYRADALHVGGDYTTEFAGIVADEAPWAMKHGGRILSEINVAGHAFAAIQALEAEIRDLRQELAGRGN